MKGEPFPFILVNEGQELLEVIDRQGDVIFGGPETATPIPPATVPELAG